MSPARASIEACWERAASKAHLAIDIFAPSANAALASTTNAHPISNEGCGVTLAEETGCFF
jgi:hypothetical protein